MLDMAQCSRHAFNAAEAGRLTGRFASAVEVVPSSLRNAATSSVQITKRGLTQTEAAEVLQIDQPKVSALVRGRLAGFSLDRLVRFLVLLGSDV